MVVLHGVAVCSEFTLVFDIVYGCFVQFFVVVEIVARPLVREVLYLLDSLILLTAAKH